VRSREMATNGSVCDVLVRTRWPGLTPESHSNPLKAFLRNYKMHLCAWSDCRWGSNFRRPWLLPQPAWRTLLEATSTERRKRANAIKHALYVLCASSFRASVDMESYATGVLAGWQFEIAQRQTRPQCPHARYCAIILNLRTDSGTVCCWHCQ
jgi:hypothetical protein